MKKKPLPLGLQIHCSDVPLMLFVQNTVHDRHAAIGDLQGNISDHTSESLAC